MLISNSVRFWLYLVPIIPSMIITIFGLYRLGISRTFQSPLKNHCKLLLLSCVFVGELFDITWHIDYYYRGTVISQTFAFCTVWIFIDSVTSVSISILIAWASIDRYMTTFHSHWLATNVKRFFFHYLPLSVCILYPMSFYFIIFFIMPCDVPFNYDSILCNRSECTFHSHSIALWESVTHYAIPVCITVAFSVTLLVRVAYYVYHNCDRVKCNKYKKTAIQLLPISVVYILLQLPPMLLHVAYTAGLSRSIAADYYSDSIYFRYWIMLFIPFAYVTPLSELRRQKHKVVVFWKRRHVVEPVMIDIASQKISESGGVVSIGW